MNRPTIPASLRQPSSHGRIVSRGTSLAMAAAAAFGTADALHAQTTVDSVILLPTVEVETAVPTPAPAPLLRRPRRSTSTPAAAPPPPAIPAVEAAPGPVAGTDGLSPYADPTAGYRAVASGNSLLGQPLAETARTVNAITSEVIRDKNATSVRELARTTPGITLGTGEGGNAFGDVLFIRGFKSTNDVYIDGIRDAGAALRETFATEQVEVTKGPSGSIAGRGTTGGAVNVVVKKPQREDFLQSETTLGTDGLARQVLDWNKVWNDRFRTRVIGMAQTGDVAGRDGISDDRRGLSLGAEYDVNDRLTLSADAYRLQMDATPDWGIPWIDGGPATETIGLDRTTTYTVDERDFQTGKQTIGTFGLKYRVAPGLELTNRTRIGRSGMDYVASVASSATQNVAGDWILNNLSAKSTFQINETLSNTTELGWSFSNGAVKHKLVAGVALSREEVEQRAYNGAISEDFGGAGVTGSACRNLVNVVNPDTSVCWPAGSTLTLSDTPRLTTVDTRSVYIQDTVSLTPSLTLNLGLRADDYDISRSGTGNAGAYAYQRNDLLTTWNAGLTYRIADNAIVYAAIATSANPMGQELDAGGGDYNGLDQAGTLLDPERNRSVEIGAKWQAGRLAFTGALFETVKSQGREQMGSGNAAVASATLGYAVRGVELGVSGKLGERLSLFGAAAVMNSAITESANADNIGKGIANFAEKQVNLLAKYDLTEDWTVGGQVTWRGPLALGSVAENGNVLPAYSRLDALAEYDLGENRVLSLRVDNLLDETYYDSAYRSSQPFVYVAPGRSAAIALKMKF